MFDIGHMDGGDLLSTVNPAGAGGGFAWDDLRYFLAVARSGSTLAASRVLGVSQTTVARRVGDLERRLRTPLFDRSQGGYRLKSTAIQAMRASEEVERSIHGFAGMFPGLKTMDTLRIASIESFARHGLMPALEAARIQLPDLRTSLVVTDEPPHFPHDAVDLAFSAGEMPAADNLVVRRLPAADQWGAYAAATSVRSEPFSWADCELLTTPRLENLPVFEWAAAQGARLIPARTTGFMSLAALVSAGEGMTLLPRALGDHDKKYRLEASVPVSAKFGLWMAYPGHLKREPILRLVVETVLTHIRSLTPPAVA